MALFGTKKEAKKKETVVAEKVTDKKTVQKTETKADASVMPASSTDPIVSPHITEKSGLQSQAGVYTFIISKGANKKTVASAVKTLYKVNPVKVSIVNLPDKKVFVRGRRGLVAGVRKAMVTVKKGEKIDFV